jgi:HAMP domain-containing protein
MKILSGRIALWVMLCGVLGGIPLAMLWFGVATLFELRLEHHHSLWQKELPERLVWVSESSKFTWNGVLGRLLVRLDRHPEPHRYLDQKSRYFSRIFQCPFVLVQFNRTGEVIHVAGPSPWSKDDLGFFMRFLWQLQKAENTEILTGFSREFARLRTFWNLRDLRLTMQRIANATWKMHEVSTGLGNSLLWVHSARKNPLMILATEGILESQAVVRAGILLNTPAKTMIHQGCFFSGSSSPLFVTDPHVSRARMKELLPAFVQKNIQSEFIDTPTHYFYVRRIGPRDVVFASRDKRALMDAEQALLLRWQVGIGLSCVPLLLWSFGIVVRQKKWNASVSKKLGLLFGFANGLPLLAIVLLAASYLGQKELALRRQAHQEALPIMQGVFERRGLYDRKLGNRCRKAFETMLTQLPRQKTDEEKVALARRCFEGINPREMYLVSEAVDETITFHEVLRGKKKPRAPTHYGVHERNGYELTAQFVPAISRKTLKQLNGEAYEDRRYQEIEILIESAARSSMLALGQKFYRTRGTVANLEVMGGQEEFCFFDMYRDPRRKTYSYALFLTFRQHILLHDYFRQIIPAASRNALALRVFLRNRRFNSFVFPPARIMKNELADQFKHFRALPPEITHGTKRYLVLTLTDRGQFDVIGLYPYSRIEKALTTLRKQLFWFFFLNLVLTITLARFLARKILMPTNALNSATKAIAQRQFQHRLAELEPDEFGRLGSIFNQVMIGLEELQVAKVVQETLFPARALRHGPFAVFGKSVPMEELGGDYYDYFPIGERKVGLVIGDVMGHGIPAALMMAVAKTCILESEGCLDQPNEVVQLLYRQFYDFHSRSKRAAMSLLYVVADGETQTVAVANAGHCLPFKISGNTLEEIPKGRGLLLGIRRELPFDTVQTVFRPGDSLVLYTDGLMEVESVDGRVMGREGLRELVMRCRSPEPEENYHRLVRAFLEFRGSGDAQDDVTILVLKHLSLEELAGETTHESR